jgi:hypothetical protein
MKCVLCGFLALLGCRGWGQSFQNLDFEAAGVIPPSTSLPIAVALPGWSGSTGYAAVSNVVSGQGFILDGAWIGISHDYAIFGQHSVYLQADGWEAGALPS